MRISKGHRNSEDDEEEQEHDMEEELLTEAKFAYYKKNRRFTRPKKSSLSSLLIQEKTYHSKTNKSITYEFNSRRQYVSNSQQQPCCLIDGKPMILKQKETNNMVGFLDSTTPFHNDKESQNVQKLVMPLELKLSMKDHFQLIKKNKLLRSNGMANILPGTGQYF